MIGGADTGRPHVILCEAATETVNLYVSVIKFLRYEGIVWSGDSLPLEVNPLGELFQTRVDLRARGEAKQGDAWWSLDNLYGTFVPGKIYDLDMRFEYRLPVEATRFGADFNSIHPKRYRFILDFPDRHVLGHDLICRFGDERHLLPLEDGWQRELSEGRAMKMVRRNDYCSAEITAASDVPYGHQSFPEFSFGDETPRLDTSGSWRT